MRKRGHVRTFLSSLVEPGPSRPPFQTNALKIPALLPQKKFVCPPFPRAETRLGSGEPLPIPILDLPDCRTHRMLHQKNTTTRHSETDPGPVTQHCKNQTLKTDEFFLRVHFTCLSLCDAAMQSLFLSPMDVTLKDNHVVIDR